MGLRKQRTLGGGAAAGLRRRPHGGRDSVAVPGAGDLQHDGRPPGRG